MRKEGNGAVGACVENLLKTERGEVRLDILRGLPGGLVDRPAGYALPELRRASIWCIQTYEPRADAEKVTGGNG